MSRCGKVSAQRPINFCVAKSVGGAGPADAKFLWSVLTLNSGDVVLCGCTIA